MFDVATANMLMELLAIKLYEHDRPSLLPGDSPRCWGELCEEDRDIFRDMTKRVAQGDNAYG